MYSKPFKRKSPIRHVFIYTVMTLSVLIIVALITMFMLGFRFNDGNLEQNAFMQFSSTPSGATVSVDGKIISSKTPNKDQVPAGRHDIVMWRDGYETWSKSVDIKPGTLTWLNYALLVPKKLSPESVANFDSIYASLASPKSNYILMQLNSNTPTFSLVDLGSDAIKTTSLTIPADIYSESSAVGVAHAFKIEKWDGAGRYVLVNHVFGDKNEWLVMDTQDVNLTKNITRLFDLSISNVVFVGTSGNKFYALDSSDIRKFDTSEGTISKPLVNNVINFEMYNDTSVITYIGNGKPGTNERVAGVYRDGDDAPSIIRTTVTNSSSPLAIATSRYFNQNYIAILDEKKIDILSGSYPNTTSDNANTMKVASSFNVTENADRLTFSPTGEHVFVQSGAYFANYDLEYQKFTTSNIEGNGAVSTLKWLDNNYLWSDRDGKLTIREFDGSNMHIINQVLVGQDATLTSNGRYLYSINKSDKGYSLQRVRMILP